MRTNLGSRHPAVLLTALLALVLAACGRDDAKIAFIPSVLSTAPADTATGVALNTKVVAYFNQPMSPPATIATNT